MADYIDRQAAIDRFENLSYADWNQGASTTWANAFSECADMIRELPSEYVVEVVRCKDCLMHGVCRFEQGLGLDGYCSQAERREDG